MRKVEVLGLGRRLIQEGIVTWMSLVLGPIDIRVLRPFVVTIRGQVP